MNTQTLLVESMPDGESLPSQAQTRSGVVFDPRLDLWEFRDGVKKVYLAFDGWGLESSELKYGFKKALMWQFRSMSPSHAVNMHVKTKHLVKFLLDQFSCLPAEFSEDHLISYAADPVVLKNGYLSGLSGFLKKWHELGYPGVSKGAVAYLNSVRLRGMKRELLFGQWIPFGGRSRLWKPRRFWMHSQMHLGIKKSVQNTIFWHG